MERQEVGAQISGTVFDAEFFANIIAMEINRAFFPRQYIGNILG